MRVILDCESNNRSDMTKEEGEWRRKGNGPGRINVFARRDLVTGDENYLRESSIFWKIKNRGKSKIGIQ